MILHTSNAELRIVTLFTLIWAFVTSVIRVVFVVGVDTFRDAKPCSGRVSEKRVWTLLDTSSICDVSISIVELSWADRHTLLGIRVSKCSVGAHDCTGSIDAFSKESVRSGAF